VAHVASCERVVSRLNGVAEGRSVPPLRRGRLNVQAARVVVEQTTEALLSTYTADTPFRQVTVNEFVVEPLMISFAMILGDEFCDSSSVMPVRQTESSDSDIPP